MVNASAVRPWLRRICLNSRLPLEPVAQNQGGHAHASVQTRRRRNALRELRAWGGALRGRLVPGPVRRNACAVRGLARGQAAAVAARPGTRMGDGRIRDAAARDADPYEARVVRW